MVSGEGTGIVNRILFTNLFFDTQSQKDNWAKDFPPVNQCAHFGISNAIGLWVFNRNRHFYNFVFEAQSFEEQIGFQFITIQPILPEIDPAVLEQR